MPKFNVAEAASKGVDLSKPETMVGLGVSLAKIAPALAAAQEVCGAFELARIREQEIQPTKVRFAIVRLRAELAAIGAWPEPSKDSGAS